MSTVTITEEEFYRLKERAGEARKPDPEQCRENGHVWKFVGGANAGCCEDCACSTSVRQCIVCNVCDYGENEETEVIIANCPDREEMEYQRMQESEARVSLDVNPCQPAEQETTCEDEQTKTGNAQHPDPYVRPLR